MRTPTEIELKNLKIYYEFFLDEDFLSIGCSDFTCSKCYFNNNVVCKSSKESRKERFLIAKKILFQPKQLELF